MKSLKFPDNLHLQAAQGWLELGNHLQADKELDEITPEMRAHPQVLLAIKLPGTQQSWQPHAALDVAILNIESTPCLQQIATHTVGAVAQFADG